MLIMRRTSRAAPERSQSERETLLTKAELKQRDLGFGAKETGQGEPGGTGILAVSSPKLVKTARNRSITAGFGHTT